MKALLIILIDHVDVILIILRYWIVKRVRLLIYQSENDQVNCQREINYDRITSPKH